jgi:uracil-DNA glycosylase family 4
MAKPGARQGFYGGGELTTRRTPLGLAASHPPACDACGLHKGCRTPFMKPYGRGRLGILVVGEAPGEEEDVRGRPLVGRSGGLVRDALIRAGAELDSDCWAANAASCRPPRNELPARAVRHCRPLVLQAVQKYKPTAILLMGGPACESLLGWLYRGGQKGADYKPSLWAGWQIPSRALDCWICPTYHPSFVLRNEKKVGDPNPARVLFQQHVADCVRLARSGRPWKGRPPDIDRKLLAVSDPRQAAALVRDMLRRAVEKGGRLSFDYETDRLKPDHPEATVHCCAIADEEKSVGFPWTPVTAQAVKEVLLEPRVQKTAYNMQFELGWTQRVLGVPIRNMDVAFDAMLGTHTLDARKGSKGLEFQAFVRCGVDSYAEATDPFMGSEDKSGNGRNRVHKISPPLLWRYCAKDAAVEYEVATALAPLVGVPLYGAEGVPDTEQAPSGEELRDAGIDAADAGVSDEWKSQADAALRSVAVRQRELTTDDVWSLIDHPPSGDPRAVAGVMDRAKRAGLVRPTGRFRKSSDSECHARDKRVWESLVCGGGSDDRTAVPE